MNQPLSTGSVVSYTRAQEKFFKRNPGNNFHSFTFKHWQFRSKFRRILPCRGRGMRGWVGLGRKHPPSQSRSPKECSQARWLLDTGFNPFTPALNFGPFSDVVLPFESVDEIPWLPFKWNLLCSSVPSCTFHLVRLLSLWMKSFGLTVEIKLCGRFPIGLSYFRQFAKFTNIFTFSNTQMFNEKFQCGGSNSHIQTSLRWIV